MTDTLLRVLTTARSAQDSLEPIQAQNSQMRTYIKAQGWMPIESCADVAVSGLLRPFERPGLGPWLKRPEDYDIILAPRSAVLSRSSDHFEELMEWADDHGIDVWTVAEGNLAEVALTRLPSMPRRPSTTRRPSMPTRPRAR